MYIHNTFNTFTKTIGKQTAVGAYHSSPCGHELIKLIAAVIVAERAPVVLDGPPVHGVGVRHDLFG